jgi:hypothetical protein
MLKRVPAGSNTGTSLRLGPGLQLTRQVARDQYVKLKVVLPDKPDPALKGSWRGGGPPDPRKAMEPSS